MKTELIKPIVGYGLDKLNDNKRIKYHWIDENNCVYSKNKEKIFGILGNDITPSANL